MSKPNKLTIILTAILFFTPFILQYFILGGRDSAAYGFPFPVVQKVTFQCAVGGPCPEPYNTFNALPLIADILILFLISLLIIFILEKLKKVTKNKFTEITLLTLILFSLFTLLSYIFSIGYPFIKAMVGIGLPLVFYAHDPYTGPGINLGSFFLWQFLLVDFIYWFVISTIVVWVQNKSGTPPIS